MALIKSAHSGYWGLGSTWIGGSLPNPDTDDVELQSGHYITTDDGDYVDVKSGRCVTVRTGGVLDVDYCAELYLYSGGTIDLEGGRLIITGGFFLAYGHVIVRRGGKVRAVGLDGDRPRGTLHFRPPRGRLLHRVRLGNRLHEGVRVRLTGSLDDATDGPN